jgi:RNA polymerase sigma-70 factor, ECF subfamily
MSNSMSNGAPWAIPQNEGPDSPKLESSSDYFSKSHWKRTYQHAYSLVQNPADAEDMAQEAYLRLFQAMSTGRRVESCVAWLKAVLRNAAFQRWRETRPDLHVPVEGEGDDKGGVIAKLIDPATSVEERLVEESLLRESLRVLAELSELDRECIMMHARGFTFVQIAKALGLSYKAAIKTTRKALVKTRRRIDPKSEVER